jgi:hypothetical protein
MKKNLLLLPLSAITAICANAQMTPTTILDFQAAPTSTVFEYFGSGLGGSVNQIQSNPFPSGINTSTMVAKYIKPAVAETWAGAYSNPNPTTAVLTNGSMIKLKVRMDHPGNVALKLEGSTSGQLDWIQIAPVTLANVNQWVELVFNTTLGSAEGDHQVPSGTFNKVVIFFDFGTMGTGTDVTSYFDDLVVEGGTVSTTNAVSFSVDMRNAALAPSDIVYVNGTFNGWTGFANPLSDTDGDKIWTGTINISPGNHAFKYTINGWSAQENFNGSETCVVTDGGYNNRRLIVPIASTMTYPLSCYNSCDVCPTVSHLVSFSVDMSNYSGSYTTVYVNGTFNNWAGTSIPLVKNANNNIWTGSASILAGSHAFKFTLDGWAGQENFNGGEPCVVSSGGNNNRRLNVTGPMTYPTYCFNKCATCGPPDPPVTFTVDMSTYTGSYTTVYISGTLNGWSGDAFPLTRVTASSNIWTGTIRLSPGDYEYKVSLDNWNGQEQFAGVEECTKTTGPYTNRVLTVPAAGISIPTFCFNSCYACGEELKITFKVGMGNVAPSTAGVWLVGGGNFEAPGGRYKMSDANNDGVYELVVPRKAGFNSFFAFANGNCPDYSCKENLAGLPCANPSNYDDRFLPAITGNTMFTSCFAQCSDNTACTYTALSADVIYTEVTCFGGNNGTINLTMSGGSTVYNYNWGGGITTRNRTGLTAGTYNVTITDGISGLTLTKNVVVPQTNLIVTTPTITNVSCFGSDNGAISLSSTGGNLGGYTYNWGNGITGHTRFGLAPNVYNVAITDAYGCSNTLAVTIRQPTEMIASAATINAGCNGAANGAISLTVSGGIPAYTYHWNDNVLTKDRTNLTSGTYTVTITDVNDCTLVLSTSVGQPNAVLLTATATNVACYGNSTGSINLSATGGAPNYSYIWSNGATTANISNLAAGVYTATVNDASNCPSIISKTITQPSAQLTVAAVASDVNCFGGATGSITLNVSGGTSGYTYKWSNLTATSQSLSNIAAGTYIATVTDANTCPSIISASVAQPSSALMATAAVTNPNCGNTTGSITINANGGTAGYSYNWGGGITTQTRTGLSIGSYTATVTDLKGCTTTVTSAIVTGSTAPVASASISNVTCFGEATGAINLTLNNGTAPYTYNWSNGANTQSINGLNNGTYSVIITDANNCTTTLSNVIAQPANALVSSSVASNINCFGTATGAISLNATGGVGAYMYNWGNGITSQSRTDLIAGTYIATVSDNNGCTSIQSNIISQPNAALSASAATSNVNCFGNATGSISLGVSGGTPGYSYNWGSGITSQNLTGLAAGTYIATVSDANGCTTTIEKIITQPSNGINATATAINIACNGNASGQATAIATGGNSNYSFLWSNGATSASINSLAAGTYNVIVSDATNCTASASVNISQPTLLSSTIGATAQTANGINNGTATVTPTGGTSPYTYTWSNGGTSNSITNLTPGVYSVVVRDANSCSISQTVTVNSYNCALSAAISGVNVSCFGGNNGSAAVNIVGAASPVAYTWSNGNTTASANALTAGTYSVQISDANGCPALLSVNITQPTALSANATATNQTVFGVNNGTATAIATGGSGVYTYLWSNGAATPLIGSLAVGTYSVIITDSNGCSMTQSVTVSAFTTCTMAVTASVQNVSCAGNANGQASLVVSNGAGPYTYSWSNGQTTANATNLSGGVYVVNVGDANGCNANTSVTILEPTTLNALIAAQTNALCFDDATGIATVQAQGGTTPYTYVWSNSNTTAMATNLLPGTYTVVVKDANGCTKSVATTITSNDTQAPIVTCPPNKIACNSQNVVTYQYPSASDNCAILGGTWDITGGLSSGSTFPVGMTTQTFTFKDVAGNVGTCSFNVTVLSAVTVGSYATSGCFQACLGTITAVGATGGQTPYTYQWSNNQTGATASALCNANLSLVVVDNAGCSNAQTFSVTIPTAISVSTPVVVNDLGGQNTGSITLTVQGGVAPFTYKWTKNGTNFPGNTPNIGNLGGGTYVLVITDANGCTFTSENIVVQTIIGTIEPSWATGMKMSPNPSSGLVQIQFSAQPTGSVQVTLIDVTGRTVAQNIFDNSQTIDLDYSNLPAGTYSVRLRSEGATSVRLLVINR